MIAMHRLGRERWQTNGYIFRAAGMRRAVLHPFPSVRNHSLTGLHFEHPISVRDTQRALEHDGELIELGRLAGFDPAVRTAHVRNADSRFAGVHPPDEFLDDFRFVSRSGNPGRS